MSYQTRIDAPAKDANRALAGVKAEVAGLDSKLSAMLSKYRAEFAGKTYSGTTNGSYHAPYVGRR